MSGVEDLTDADLVSDLCEVESGLSEWEVDFVDDIAEWLKTHESLTARQREKAEEIHEGLGL